MSNPISRRAAIIATAVSALGVSAAAVSAQDDAAEPYVTMRIYQFKEGTDRQAMIDQTHASLIPLLRTLEGWTSFMVLEPDPLTWFAVTEWATQDDADAGGAVIKEWVAQNVAEHIESGPESFAGKVNIAVSASDSVATPAAT